MAEAGWYADPSGVHEKRWFDGTRWTDHVSNGGVVGHDPVPAAPMSTTYAPRVAADSWPNATTTQPAPPPSKRRPWPVLIAAAVVGLAGVAAFVALAGAGDEDKSTAATASATTAVGSPSTVAPAGTARPTATTTTVMGAGSPDDPLPLGTAATIGDYEVELVSFVGDGTAAILEANEFNEPPDDGYVYALVGVRATYRGEGEGYPGIDLSVGYVGADQRVYVDTDCFALEPDSLLDQGEVVHGGTVEGSRCLHLPSDVVGTGALFAEPFLSLDDDAKVWWTDR